MTEQEKPPAASEQSAQASDAVSLSSVAEMHATETASSVDESTTNPANLDALASVDRVEPEQVVKSCTAGEQLRSLREQAGISLAELASLLKVPERKLELLESDAHDQLPGLTFVRALASSVCRTLKVDNAPILALLPSAQSSDLARTSEGINAPFRKPSDMMTTGVLWEQHKQTILIVGGLVLSAVVLFNLPQNWLKPSSASKSPGMTTEQVQPSLVAASAVLPAADSASQAVLEPQAPASQVQAAVPTASQASGLDSQVNQVAGKTTTGHSAEPQAGKFVKDLVSFEARADSWIEVAQSDGQVL
ncbi:MAG: hypothetical protein RLZZ271_1369, partial [Pseudomonadota bacterium]